jgi:hypothetical protein
MESLMSTINGIGTLYYGWTHLPDGSAHATKWFVIAFLPVIPLSREHLRVITSGTKPSFLSLRGSSDWHVGYHFHGKVPMDFLGVLVTYVKAYLLMPIVLFAPAAAVMFLVFGLALPDRPDARTFTSSQTALIVGATLMILLYWGIVTAWILDRCRGIKK